ncbi:MAG TPA: hypothetical protein VGQ42_13990 [Candidatus Dormibacteraeota bacterium]|jgi:hypothetical protein|nr:hypothetical protein [Candidatus Dormibacteraeota bacterium]
MGYGPVYRYTAGKMDWLAAGWPHEGEQSQAPYAGDLVRAGVPECSPGERMGDVRARVDGSGWDRCVVVNSGRIVMGLLSGARLQADAELTADLAMEPGPHTFRPSIGGRELLDWMRKNNKLAALIADGDGVLIGSVDRHTIEEALHARG